MGVQRLPRRTFLKGLGLSVSLPLLEAMASGVPVVASDIGVFRELGGDAAFDTTMALYLPPGKECPGDLVDCPPGAARRAGQPVGAASPDARSNSSP